MTSVWRGPGTAPPPCRQATVQRDHRPRIRALRDIESQPVRGALTSVTALYTLWPGDHAEMSGVRLSGRQHQAVDTNARRSDNDPKGAQHVKVRSRIIGAAAVAGMAATAVAVGGAGVATAAPTTLVSCTHVHFEAKFTPPVSISSPASTVAGILPDPAGTSDTHCTTPSGVGHSVPTGLGDFQSITGKLANGSQSCNPDPTANWPLSGAVTVTYSGVDPASLSGAHFASTAFIRTAADNPSLLDAISIHGIVTKGVGIGGDVAGGFIQMPIPPTKLAKNPVKGGPPPTPAAPPTAAGPSYQSAAYSLDCALGFGAAAGFGLPAYDPYGTAFTPDTYALFSSNSLSVLGILGADPSLRLDAPLTISYPG